MSETSAMTSREAWEWYRDTGRYSRRIMQIIEVMMNKAPMNQRQVIEECRRLPGNSTLTDHAITPRFAPMLRVNLIRETGTIKCPFTGRETTAYELTYELPTGDIREASQPRGVRRLREVEAENRTLHERIHELEAEIARMRSEKGQMSWAM